MNKKLFGENKSLKFFGVLGILFLVLLFVGIGYSAVYIDGTTDTINVTYIDGFTSTGDIDMGGYKFISLFTNPLPVNNLVGYWSFLHNTTEISGNQEDATNIRAVHNYSWYELDEGVNSYMRIYNFDAHSGATDFTWSSWVKRKPGQVASAYVLRTSDDSFGIGSYSPNKLSCNIKENDNSYINLEVSDTSFNNNWVFVTCVYNSIDMQMYVNGKLRKSTTSPNDKLMEGSADLVFGAEGVNAYHFNGSIGTVIIQNTSLSSDEVNILYNQQGGEFRKGVDEGDLMVDIRTYGAIDDDGLDDWLAIQTAINETALNGGGIVFFPAGRWHISKTLHFYGGIRYLGASEGYDDYGTEIYLLANSDVTMIEVGKSISGGNNYFPVIEHLQLNGNRGNQAGTSHGIQVITGLYDLYINDVIIFNTHDYGLRIDSGKVFINNFYTEYCNKGVYLGGDANYVYINNLYDIFSYEDSFVVEAINFLSVTNSVIGITRGAEHALYLNHSHGDAYFSNVFFRGPESGQSPTSAIINISTSGTGYTSISDSSVYSGENVTYALWNGSSVEGSDYSINNINYRGTHILNRDNGVQHTRKNNSGIVFENMNLYVSKKIYAENMLEETIISSGEGLINYWAFDEKLGSIAYDMEGGNNGIINNTIARVKGNFGNALEFNGVNNSVEIEPLNFSESFTLSAWIKPEDCTDGAIIGDFKTNGDKFLFWFDEEGTCGRLGFYSDNGTPEAARYGYTNFNQSEWKHAGFVYNGTYGKIYLNGVSDSNWGAHNSLISMNSVNLSIGNSPGERTWNGTIDEVKIWNRALSLQDMYTEYLLGISSHAPTGHLLPKTGGTIAGELNITGISGDGTGKVVCIKSDGNLGTCTDQPNGTGYCSCS